MRFVDFVEVDLRSSLRANHHFLCGESDKHKLRDKQHPQLGSNGSDEHCHHAGNIHLHIGKRLNQHESNGDYYLHVNRKQHRWLDHLYPNGHSKYVRQTNDQFLYR